MAEGGFCTPIEEGVKKGRSRHEKCPLDHLRVACLANLQRFSLLVHFLWQTGTIFKSRKNSGIIFKNMYLKVKNKRYNRPKCSDFRSTTWFSVSTLPILFKADLYVFGNNGSKRMEERPKLSKNPFFLNLFPLPSSEYQEEAEIN